MTTRTTAAGKAAHHSINKGLQLLNHILKEEHKMIIKQKRDNALERKNALLATMVKTMREQGASDQAIRKALPGLGEFAKFVDRKMSLERELFLRRASDDSCAVVRFGTKKNRGPRIVSSLKIIRFLISP